MSRERKLLKKLTVERRQKIAFGSFVVSLFLLAITNAAADAHPAATYVSVALVAFSAISLYVSYKLTP